MGYEYAYLTRKQAGIVYAATKSGDITMTKKAIGMMYDAVGCPYVDLRDDLRAVAVRADRAIGHLFEGRTDIAQAILDGKDVCSRPHVLGHVHFEVTEDNVEEVRERDNLFAEVGDVMDYDVTDGFDWFIVEA